MGEVSILTALPLGDLRLIEDPQGNMLAASISSGMIYSTGMIPRDVEKGLAPYLMDAEYRGWRVSSTFEDIHGYLFIIGKEGLGDQAFCFAAVNDLDMEMHIWCDHVIEPDDHRAIFDLIREHHHEVKYIDY